MTRRGFADSVTANYFETFGSPLTIGRAFTPAEAEPGANLPVAIVSYSFWEREDRRPDILGESIRVNGQRLTIIGVAGEAFTGSSVLVGPELWLPLGLYGSITTDFIGTDRALADRDNHALEAVRRQAPDLRAPLAGGLSRRQPGPVPALRSQHSRPAGVRPRACSAGRLVIARLVSAGSPRHPGGSRRSTTGRIGSPLPPPSVYLPSRPRLG